MATRGGVNDGRAALPPTRLTGGPPTCVHENTSASPSGSEDPVPSRVTSVLFCEILSSPAFAIGGRFSMATEVVSVPV